MSHRRNYLALSGTALSLLLMVGCGTPNGSQVTGANGQPASANTVNVATSGIVKGAKAPAFSLPQLNGKGNISLKQLLGSKPIILNAWASWCGPCQQEQPDLLAMAKQYASQVTVIGVNMTGQDSISGAKKFVSDYKVTYPVLTDSKSEFFNAYQLAGFPTTFLISPAGKIEAVHVGLMTKSQMQALFNEALGKPAAS